MIQEIPIAWLRGSQLHPSKYHDEMMKLLLRAKPRGRTRWEIQNKFPYVLLEPDNKDGIDVILSDFYYNGIAREYETNRRARGGKEVTLMEWRLESKEPPEMGYFLNSLSFEHGAPRLVKEPPPRPVKKKKLTPVKIVIDNP